MADRPYDNSCQICHVGTRLGMGGVGRGLCTNRSGKNRSGRGNSMIRSQGVSTIFQLEVWQARVTDISRDFLET